MARVSIWVLGPLDAHVDDRPVDLGGPRQRRVLARLAVRAGQVVSATELVDAVWDEAERPPNAERSVRTYVSRLRRSLADAGAPDEVVRTRPSGYELDGVATLDAARLAELVNAARSAVAAGELALAVEQGDRAIGLRRGRPYGELADEPWLRAEVRRLEDLHAAALEERAEALLALGRPEQVASELGRWCTEHPLRERLRGQLVLALYRSGRQADALRAYQSFRRTLAERTGLEPGPELRQLESRILAQDPALALTAEQGRPLRAYRLVERIGEGSFAVVWKGLQPSVGREVAVKQIRAELANRPEFIRHFDAEAHLVARLEHPHVVPLYDYWREPGSAYLVMRWLRGGSLEERLAASGPLGASDCVRLADQIGAALASAHRAGVVHRDVKPANVLVDGEGNYFLGDFGIALEAAGEQDPTSALSAGSPAYASPEQLRRQAVGPATDVWGLGIVVYEALTGQLPFPEERSQAGLLRRQLHDPLPSVRAVRAELPPRVDEVIQRATAKDPAGRYPDVATMVAELGDALTGRPDRASSGVRHGGATVLGDLHANPYKGLRPFTEADAADFFGRDRLVDRLADRLCRPGPAGRLLVVVGPSGSGKSSLVRAGLVPALRAGRVEGSDAWFLTTMVPGAEPFEELAAALARVSVAGGSGWLDGLAADERGLSRAAKALLPDETSELVLIVDQLEELFTLGDDEARRRLFLRALAVAVTDPRSRLRVVASMRADFWDRPLRYPELAGLLEEATVFVGPLAADELERAIVDPAERAGAQFEPGLVSEIVADVADEPGALPLLQYALTELFERHVSGLLTSEAYADLGGLVGALARRAEELFEHGSDAERAAARRLFDRLVTPGEGTEDTRRRVLRSELGTGAATATVIDSYGAARLLSFDRDPVSREPTVEVAHEALIRGWPRLRAWLDEDRDGLRVHRHLTEAARAWEQRGRDASELYRGARLAGAEDWAAGHAADLNASERAFLDASRARREAERARERRQVRRLRSSLVAVAVVAVLALVAGVVAAVAQRRSARNAELAADERDRATAATRLSDLNRLIAQSKAEASDQADLAMLLALEADRLEPSVETESTILNSLQAESRFLNGYGDRGRSQVGVAILGEEVAELTSTGAVRRFDLLSGVLRGECNPEGVSQVSIGAFAFGSRMVAMAFDGVVRAFAIDGCAPLGPPIPAPVADGRQSWSLELSTDDRVLYVGGGPGQPAPGTGVGIVARLDPRSGQALGPPWQAHTSGIDALRLSPDGRRLATGARDATVVVWDVPSGTPLGPPLVGHRAMVRDAAWSADGTQLATTSMTPAELLVWDPAGSALRLRIPLPHSVPPSVAFAPDGQRLASAGPEGTMILWDARTGAQLGTPVKLQGSAGNPRFTPDGRSVVVGGPRLTRLSVDGSPTAGRLIGRSDSRSAVWRPDGSMLALVAADGGIELADPGSGASLGSLPEPPRPGRFPPDAKFSPDGATLAVGAGSAVVLYDVASRTARARIDVRELLDVWRLRFNPDGRLLAVGGRQIVGFYDPATGQAAGPPVAIPVTGGQPGGVDLRFTPDGRTLHASPFLQPLVQIDVAERTLGRRSEGPPLGVDLSADGTTLAVGVIGQGVDLADAAAYQLAGQAIRVGAQEPLELRFTPHDARLVTLSLDRVIRIVDLASRSVVNPGFAVPASAGPVVRFDVSPDGRRVAAPTDNGVILWDLEPDRWRQRACEVVGRNLTAAEWDRYLPNSGARRKTCEQWGLL